MSNEPTLQEKELLDKLTKVITEKVVSYEEAYGQEKAAASCLSILQEEIQKAKEGARKEALMEMHAAFVLHLQNPDGDSELLRLNNLRDEFIKK